MTTVQRPLDAATRKKVLAAMKKRDWDRVAKLVAEFPVIRRALFRLESYAMVERQEPTRSSKHSVGWVRVDHTVRHCTHTERFLKERGLHGEYRIISIKRRANITADGSEPIVDLAVPRSKPMYELEQWCGRPTTRKRSAWTRLPFPTDWRQRGADYKSWIVTQCTIDDTEEAMAYLHKHRRQGWYRVITVKRKISIGIVDGKERKWSGHCRFPDDGRSPEYEPLDQSNRAVSQGHSRGRSLFAPVMANRWV
jgi:hypothetical protein